MKKLFRMILILCFLVSATLIVSAEDTSSVKLNLENGDIDITPTGYTQGGGQEVAFTGDYVITGSLTYDTPLQIVNNSGEEATFDITLNNAKIVGDMDCTAFRIDGNSPVVLNLTIEGVCEINADNHSAIKVGNNSSVTVNITTAENAKLTLTRRDSDGSRPEVYDTDGRGNLDLLTVKIDDVIPYNYNNKPFVTHTHQFGTYEPDNGTATCKEDGTKSATCSECNGLHTITDEGSKKHIFETGVCPFCGLHGADLQQEGITWLKYEMNDSTTWFGIDNSNDEFEEGSHFWIEWINPENQTSYNAYWNQLDTKHKDNIENNNYKLFQIGVTKKDGTEYTILDEGKSASLYVQTADDWDKDDLKAAYISNGADEDVFLEVIDNLEYTDGKAQFAKLTLKHFSPYIIYDELTADEEKTDTSILPEDVPTGDSGKGATGVPKTGDTSSLVLMGLFGISCAVIVYTTKQSFKRTHRQ
ncbi:MAG: hypothetical protein IJZ53_02110 [Tyzzerella sp.]|nr:hypothetical protein [Tyzzerella sp.]